MTRFGSHSSTTCSDGRRYPLLASPLDVNRVTCPPLATHAASSSPLGQERWRGLQDFRQPPGVGGRKLDRRVDDSAVALWGWGAR